MAFRQERWGGNRKKKMKLVQRLLQKSTYTTSIPRSLFLTGSLYFDYSQRKSAGKTRKKHRRILSNTPVIGATGIEQSAKDPQKQGLFDNADNAAPQFCPQVNFYEQILTLFDRLEADQQAALLETLQGRIQSAAGISR